MSLQKPINQYVCDTCGDAITTIDREEGTTPMMLACRATPGCDGTMYSRGYSVDQSLIPTHEWYRPPIKSLKNRMRGWREHVEMGGLLIRPIKVKR